MTSTIKWGHCDETRVNITKTIAGTVDQSKQQKIWFPNVRYQPEKELSQPWENCWENGFFTNPVVSSTSSITGFASEGLHC